MASMLASASSASMASASASAPGRKSSSFDAPILALATQEKAAIDYLDAFIVGRSGAAQNVDVPITSFPGHVGWGEHVRDYIGRTPTDVKNFITCRCHLWEVSRTGNVRKISSDVRRAVRTVVSFMNERYNHSGFNAIGGVLGLRHPNLKHLFKGADTLRAFLDTFPNLFALKLGEKLGSDQVYVCYATVVNDVVLPSMWVQQQMQYEQTQYEQTQTVAKAVKSTPKTLGSKSSDAKLYTPVDEPPNAEEQSFECVCVVTVVYNSHCLAIVRADEEAYVSLNAFQFSSTVDLRDRVRRGDRLSLRVEFNPASLERANIKKWKAVSARQMSAPSVDELRRKLSSVSLSSSADSKPCKEQSDEAADDIVEEASAETTAALPSSNGLKLGRKRVSDFILRSIGKCETIMGNGEISKRTVDIGCQTDLSDGELLLRWLKPTEELLSALRLLSS